MTMPDQPSHERYPIGWMSRRVVFVTLMVFVILPLTFLLDAPIRSTLQDFHLPAILRLMQVLTWIGASWVLMVTALILLGIGVWRRYERLKEAGVRGLIALAGASVVVEVIKHLSGRPRPRLVDAGVFGWGPSFENGHDSFPSGHTTLTFALAMVLSSLYPAARWIWTAAAVLVAVTRVYIDAHFASDVLAGSVLGVLIGWKASRLKMDRLS